MLKKRFFCTVLALLMILALLPAFARTADADTLITGFTLATTGDFPTPHAGDAVYGTSGLFYVAATEPAGHESALSFYPQWYDSVNNRYINGSSPSSAEFTPGKWELLLYVNAAGGTVFDYDNDRFITGDLSALTLGGWTFEIFSRSAETIGYFAGFEVDDAGTAPKFLIDE